MIPATLPPVHSPIPPRALAAGAAALLAPARFDERIDALVRARYGSRALLWTDSGTSALRLALEGVQRVRPGPVALPAYCCYDVATSAVGAGADVLLYDLDPDTLSPDPASLADVVSRGAVAIVVAHLYGIPVDMDVVARVAEGHGAVVVEDAAQGTGGWWGDRPLGAVGSLGILSFGRGKGVTGGRGGLLLANDSRGEEVLVGLAARLGTRRAGVGPLGASASQWLFGRRRLYAVPGALPWLRLGDTVYRPPWPPSALPRSAAGLLSHTLRSADRAATERRERAARLLEWVDAGGPFRAIRPPDASVPGYLRLPLLLPETESSARPSRELRRLGVMPGYPEPLGSLPPLREAILAAPGPQPGARLLTERLVTLPVHRLLREPDLRRLEAWLS